jgi:hypothetical protein
MSHDDEFGEADLAVMNIASKNLIHHLSVHDR